MVLVVNETKRVWKIKMKMKIITLTSLGPLFEELFQSRGFFFITSLFMMNNFTCYDLHFYSNVITKHSSFKFTIIYSLNPTTTNTSFSINKWFKVLVRLQSCNSLLSNDFLG